MAKFKVLIDREITTYEFVATIIEAASHEEATTKAEAMIQASDLPWDEVQEEDVDDGKPDWGVSEVTPLEPVEPAKPASPQPIIVPPLTWLQASAFLKPGDRIRITEAYGNYPIIPAPVGTMGTVAENSLNELQAILLVKLDRQDDDPVTGWDYCLQLSPDDPSLNPGAWDKPVPFERI